MLATSRIFFLNLFILAPTTASNLSSIRYPPFFLNSGVNPLKASLNLIISCAFSSLLSGLSIFSCSFFASNNFLAVIRFALDAFAVHKADMDNFSSSSICLCLAPLRRSKYSCGVQDIIKSMSCT
jgi:hypothetical protein